MEWRQRGSEWRFCLFFVSIFCCILGVFIETAVPKVVYDGSTDDRQINQRPFSLFHFTVFMRPICNLFVVHILCVAVPSIRCNYRLFLCDDFCN